jgi:8-oxo-dGTP pyrophosphatase MutT (NUDIX family)
MPHVNEKLDFVSDVFIVHENKVLLRKHDKYKIWLSVGGHIESGEDPAQAAIREAKEEVGLDITLAGNVVRVGDPKKGRELLVPRFINRHWVSDTHEHVSFIYFATTADTNIRQGETEISDDIRWFTKGDLDDPAFGVTEGVRYHAREALKALGT